MWEPTCGRSRAEEWKEIPDDLSTSWWPPLCVKVLVIQSCLTLCYPTDYNLSGSSVHGILQVRILEWVAIPFSRESSQPRDWTWVSCITGRFFTIWVIRKAQPKGKGNYYRRIPEVKKKETVYYQNLYMSFMFFFLLKLVRAFQFISERILIQLIYILWLLDGEVFSKQKRSGNNFKGRDMRISLMSVDESHCDASPKTLEIRKIRLLCVN